MQTDRRGPNIESPGHGLSIVVEKNDYGTSEQKAIGITNGS